LKRKERERKKKRKGEKEESKRSGKKIGNDSAKNKIQILAYAHA